MAFDSHQDSPLSDIVTQLEIAKATEFFALLVVVPTSAGGGNEAEVLRRHVSNSVFQHDFVVLDGRHLADVIAEGSTQRLVEVMLRQGVGLYSLSPYVVNGPVPERMFFGREQDVKVISQNLVDRDYAVLGGRRIGKSSILQRLDRLLNADPRYFALYINCEDKWIGASFWKRSPAIWASSSTRPSPAASETSWFHSSRRTAPSAWSSCSMKSTSCWRARRKRRTVRDSSKRSGVFHTKGRAGSSSRAVARYIPTSTTRGPRSSIFATR